MVTAAELPCRALQLDASGSWLRLLGRCAIRAGLLGKSPRRVFLSRGAGMAAGLANRMADDAEDALVYALGAGALHPLQSDH